MTPPDLLVCPGCRTFSHAANGEVRIDVKTIDPVGDLRVCECGRRYPVIDGVPIVMADPTGFMRAELATLVERDLPVEVAELLAQAGPDDAPYPRLLEHLSIYLDAHWGDRATPPPDGPGAGLATAAVIERIAARPRVGAAVELGCSTGRIVAELAATAERVVGLDLHFGALRRARRLLDGQPVSYGRRITGRHYQPVTIAPGPRLTDRVTLVCGDALDPPLLPRVFDRVVALNVLDSVRSPRQLLAVVDSLCAPGGELILSSPFAWQSAVMADDERLGGADPAAEVVRVLTTGDGLGSRYVIEDEAELPWTLRRDARNAVTYRIHYVRARAVRIEARSAAKQGSR